MNEIVTQYAEVSSFNVLQIESVVLRNKWRVDGRLAWV